jgi:hypothetical protein
MFVSSLESGVRIFASPYMWITKTVNSIPSEFCFIRKQLQGWESRMYGMLLQQPLAEFRSLWVVIRVLCSLQMIWIQALLVKDSPDSRLGIPSTAAILLVLFAGLLATWVRVLFSKSWVRTALGLPRSCATGTNLTLSLRFWWILVNILASGIKRPGIAPRTDGVPHVHCHVHGHSKYAYVCHLCECVFRCHVRTRKQPFDALQTRLHSTVLLALLCR